MMAFGQPVNTIYDFSKADRILSLGSDFLSAMPGTLCYARDYAAGRRITTSESRATIPYTLYDNTPRYMSRLYVVESTPTITAPNTDHRFSFKPRNMEFAASALQAQI